MELNRAYKDEELFWSQKARSRWLKEGDRNTAFFHISVMAKRKRNRISAIQKANGNWCTSEEEIEKELCDHYTELFKSSQPEGLQEILHEVTRTITRQMNEQLIKPVEKSEIKLALFSMHPNKAPGIDGMSPLFFQQYCQIISVDIINAVNGFFHSSNLLRWIMVCISSVSYSFNLNGGKVGHVLPSRDDSLLCCKATKQEAGTVKVILKKYEKASGQMVNYEKSAMIFSGNTLNQDRKEIGEELGNMTEAISGKYLGLPMAIGKSKRQVFEYVKRKISDKMQGWKHKLLSPGSKEVLIKAVVMAIPNYTMSCFKLPRSLCKDIGSRIAKFWWENGEGENRMHWASWKKLTEVKGKGGIGFRDLEAFNTALLAKQIWRFITAPNLLVSRVMKAKYMKDQWQEKKPPSSSSWAWKSIHSARHLLLNGLWKRIGDGSTVEIWKDKWITGNPNGKPASTKPANCKIQKVSDLILEGKWDKLKLQLVFNQEEAKLIANIPLSIFRRKDRMFWKDSKSGSYTVKSGYARAKQERQSEGRREEAGEETSWEIRKHTIWKNLWKLNVKAKLKHFMWKVLQNCLPVKEVIHKRTGKGDPICEGCGEATETVEHLFFHCPIAEMTWKMAPVKWEGAMLLRDNIWRWWETVIQVEEENQGRDRVNITINLLWQLWKARNKRIFEHRVIEERDK
ncbi:uncharacterized protein [Coffea arabica]|uniref:Reverse transcriptase zinc-binding domain-containing protein n=1 Tax=Coffea arabica TaxID=13443 RepID=A0ABM4UQN3_COFAR